MKLSKFKMLFGNVVTGDVIKTNRGHFVVDNGLASTLNSKSNGNCDITSAVYRKHVSPSRPDNLAFGTLVLVTYAGCDRSLLTVSSTNIDWCKVIEWKPYLNLEVI